MDLVQERKNGRAPSSALSKPMKKNLEKWARSISAKEFNSRYKSYREGKLES